VTASGNVFYAEVKANGSFCVYPGQPGGGAQSIWCASATAPAGQQPFLIMNGDGNLILNTGALDRPTGSYWQSGVVYAQLVLAQPQYGSIRWSEDISGACPPACARNFLVGSTISLHAVPPTGGTFREWAGGRCGGGATVNPCVVQVTAYVPSMQPIGARNTSPPYRFVNPGRDASPESRTLWWGPRGGSQGLFAGPRPPDDPASFFVIDGDTIRPASNRNLCWSYHAPSKSISMQTCGSPAPNTTQTGWTYRADDRTIRNTNFAQTCVEFNADGFALMSAGACFVDDPRAPDAWWVSRWNLQP
jgi:hypothetical protein